MLQPPPLQSPSTRPYSWQISTTAGPHSVARLGIVFCQQGPSSEQWVSDTTLNLSVTRPRCAPFVSRSAVAELKIEPHRLIEIQQVPPASVHLVSHFGLRPGLYGVSVLYNEYYHHAVDHELTELLRLAQIRRQSVITLPGVDSNESRIAKLMSDGKVAEMPADYVMIFWANRYVTTTYVLEQVRWADRGYKRLRFTDGLVQDM